MNSQFHGSINSSAFPALFDHQYFSIPPPSLSLFVFTFAEMETTATAPYHSNQKLVIHLIRHAHGLHNLESERHRDPLKRIQYADPELSPLGWQQVREQRKDLSASGLLERIELVVTSPLTRTLQTSVGIFGSPLKDENTVGNGYQNGIKTPIFNHPPIIASELCRERLSKGRSRGTISQCRSRFPQVDFSLIEREDDILWEADERESNESVAAKGIKFIKWLLARKEKEIAVVSHGVFLQQTLIALKNEFDSSIEKEFLTPFGNCEIRSLKFFRESVVRLGQDYKKN
ncbi:phosphoglycerate mutase-like protein 1 isoform X7 [Gossypium hirsutum]|uniref:Phosphoglycerate mutase-like protein 1 isoform X7 n=2 Tax=Gossypium TaxID=3633 RepID=A0ABM3ADH3_GOSHI|nr:phosphoglycerate mutase-like protein 1 isoform X7 [Gossypium hirsutum]